ncbi:MAG: helix-turn-helix domain-containing protein [Actinomycetota bacterium]|nr:helix-turn-helix domain-containing protein [Actinomycetota bacterium]
MNPAPSATPANLEAWARAVESRDSRFDGWVIVGVTSTGIYCRPSCPTPVRPKRANMRFFATPASAQMEGFRACKRCLPDAAPGSPEWNRRDDLVGRAIRAIDDGLVDRVGVQGLARHLAVSSRHLHRLLSTEVGATPVALARARRARAARVLIETTDLPFGEVAFGSGFDSIRQFNDTVNEVFACTPTVLRAKATQQSARRSGHRPTMPDAVSSGAISLRLAHRAPYDRDQVLAWLGSHAVPGVEAREGWCYSRSLRLPHGPAVVALDLSSGTHVEASFWLTSLVDLQTALHRCRRMLDLDADPAVVDESLGVDPLLAAGVARHPGTRSPADVDGFDALLRAIIHQQVSVASAVGVLARLTAAHGHRLDPALSFAALGGERSPITTVFPDAEVWAALDPDELGLPASRAATVVAAARAVAEGTVDLSPGADREAARQQLLRIKGIGPWTVAVTSLRGLSDPDVFVPGDLALERSAQEVARRQGIEGSMSLEARSLGWSPWRSYAMHHLWRSYAPKSAGKTAGPDTPLETTRNPMGANA